MASQDTVNPNELGAPAEGFGQTVSFAFNEKAPTPQMSPVNSSGPRGGSGAVSQGQLASTDVRITKDPGSSALDLLVKVGEGVLKKNVEAEANRAYVDGMVQVMQGKAFEEIKESQPWFSRIFGDAPVVEGARAYNVHATVQRKIADEMANLQSLAQLGPAEASSHYANMIKTSLSGTDEVGDALVVKGMTEALPGLMKAQAKAHYGYKQLVASKAEDASMAAGGDNLQAMGASLANGTVTYDDMQRSSMALVQSLLPAPGRDEASYLKNMTSNIKLWAQKGNLHAINALRNSGFIDKAGLTEEQQIGIDRAVQAAELRAANGFHLRNAVQIGMIEADADQPHLAGKSPEQLVKQMQELDAQFRNETGSTGAVFGAKGISGNVKTAIAAIRAERERSWAAGVASADKERSAAVLESAVVQSAAGGSVGRLMYQPGFSSDMIHQKFEGLVRSQPADKAAGLIISNYNSTQYVNPLLQSSMTAALNAAGTDKMPSNGALQAIATYDGLVATGGVNAANAYFKDFAPQIQTFKLMSQGGDPATVGQAWQVAFGDPAKFPKRSLTNKEEETVRKLISSDNSNYLPEMMGGNPDIRPESAAQLMAQAQPAVERWMRVPGMTPELAYKHAINGLQGGATEILGGFVFENQGTPFKKLMSPLGGIALPEGSEHVVFKSFMHDFLKVPASGSIAISPEGVLAGKQQFVVWNTGNDGMPKVTRFDSDTLAMYSASQADRLRGGKPLGTQKEAPPLPPGVYDPVKAWEEKSARQAGNQTNWAFGSQAPKPVRFKITP